MKWKLETNSKGLRGSCLKAARVKGYYVVNTGYYVVNTHLLPLITSSTQRERYKGMSLPSLKIVNCFAK